MFNTRTPVVYTLSALSGGFAAAKLQLKLGNVLQLKYRNAHVAWVIPKREPCQSLSKDEGEAKGEASIHIDRATLANLNRKPGMIRRMINHEVDKVLDIYEDGEFIGRVVPYRGQKENTKELPIELVRSKWKRAWAEQAVAKYVEDASPVSPGARVRLVSTEIIHDAILGSEPAYNIIFDDQYRVSSASRFVLLSQAKGTAQCTSVRELFALLKTREYSANDEVWGRAALIVPKLVTQFSACDLALLATCSLYKMDLFVKKKSPLFVQEDMIRRRLGIRVINVL